MISSEAMKAGGVTQRHRIARIEKCKNRSYTGHSFARYKEVYSYTREEVARKDVRRSSTLIDPNSQN